VFAPGRAGDGVEAARRMLAVAESPFTRNSALLLLACALVEAGRTDAARRTMAERTPLGPARNAREMAAVLLFRDRAAAERYAATLVTAGVQP
jgi:hypothetical protein